MCHTSGCYPIPIRCLYGTAAECNFWDIVYSGAFQGDGAFDTSTQELVEQTGLSRQMVGKLQREAIEHNELVKDVSWTSGRRSVMRIPGYDLLTKGIIWKPLGYVHNGWHRVITPAIPKRVLNLYLQQPRQRIYRLDPGYVAAKCRRRFPHGKTRAVASLNLADVGKALRLLVRLGLLVPENGGFRIDWDTFNRPAPAEGVSFDAPDPHDHPLFREAAAADCERAKCTLELLDIGHLDLETHFADVFRDLAYLRSTDYTVLKSKVYRHRNRPPGPDRWRDVWRAFQYELKRRIVEVQGPKQVLHLEDTASSACAMTLDLEQSIDSVLAMRMVSRVEWPWYLEAGFHTDPTVHLELRADQRVLFAKALEPSDAEVRYALDPGEWVQPDTPLTLMAQCNRSLPYVHVEAWLEARLRR